MIYISYIFFTARFSTIHVGKYTVRHMDPMEYIYIYIYARIYLVLN